MPSPPRHPPPVLSASEGSRRLVPSFFSTEQRNAVMIGVAATQDFTSEWRELGAQVIAPRGDFPLRFRDKGGLQDTGGNDQVSLTILLSFAPGDQGFATDLMAELKEDLGPAEVCLCLASPNDPLALDRAIQCATGEPVVLPILSDCYLGSAAAQRNWQMQPSGPLKARYGCCRSSDPRLRRKG